MRTWFAILLIAMAGSSCSQGPRNQSLQTAPPDDWFQRIEASLMAGSAVEAVLPSEIPPPAADAPGVTAAAINDHLRILIGSETEDTERKRAFAWLFHAGDGAVRSATALAVSARIPHPGATWLEALISMGTNADELREKIGADLKKDRADRNPVGSIAFLCDNQCYAGAAP